MLHCTVPRLAFADRIDDGFGQNLMPICRRTNIATQKQGLGAGRAVFCCPTEPARLLAMISKLEMFIALAREQHFGRAAESIGVTQPSLSTAIKQLEEQLGVALVLRGSRFGGLTPEGQRVLEWARRITGDVRQMRQELHPGAAQLAGHVRIAVIPTALTWASALVGQLHGEYPELRVTVLSRSSEQILGMIENFDVEAGMTYLDSGSLGRMIQTPLYRERYLAVLPGGHELAGHDRLGWDQLAVEKLCLLTPDMQNRRIINAAFMEAGLAPEPVVETSSTLALMSLVAVGDMATILPEGIARFLAKGHKVALVPIAPPQPDPLVGLIVPHRDPQTPSIQALVRAAKRFALSIE